RPGRRRLLGRPRGGQGPDRRQPAGAGRAADAGAGGHPRCRAATHWWPGDLGAAGRAVASQAAAVATPPTPPPPSAALAVILRVRLRSEKIECKACAFSRNRDREKNTGSDLDSSLRGARRGTHEWTYACWPRGASWVGSFGSIGS